MRILAGHRMTKPNPLSLRKLVSLAVHCVQLQQEHSQRQKSGALVTTCRELRMRTFLALERSFGLALCTLLYLYQRTYYFSSLLSSTRALPNSQLLRAFLSACFRGMLPLPPEGPASWSDALPHNPTHARIRHPRLSLSGSAFVTISLIRPWHRTWAC